jgi:hypothetical protein
MNNPFRSGTPDFLYEGSSCIFWIEHKWIEIPWTEVVLPADICNTKSWIAQRLWLERANKNNQKVRVLVGSGMGRTTIACLLPYPFSFDPMINLFLPIKTLADYLSKCLTGNQIS